MTSKDKQALAEWLDERIVALRYGLKDQVRYVAMPMDADDLAMLEAIAAHMSGTAKKSPLTGKLKEYAERMDCPALTEALIGFAQLRKEKRKPLTDRAMGLIVGKLEQMPPDPVDKAKIVDYCVERGWTSIYYSPAAFEGDGKSTAEGSFDTDEFFSAALKRSMEGMA